MTRRGKLSARNKAAFGGALLGAALLAGCASAPGAGEAAPQWLKLEQVEKRFAIFTDAPVAPAEGALRPSGWSMSTCPRR
jgi:hypothetical protein